MFNLSNHQVLKPTTASGIGFVLLCHQLWPLSPASAVCPHFVFGNSFFMPFKCILNHFGRQTSERVRKRVPTNFECENHPIKVKQDVDTKPNQKLEKKKTG